MGYFKKEKTWGFEDSMDPNVERAQSLHALFREFAVVAANYEFFPPILENFCPLSVGQRFAAALLPLLFGTNPRSHHKGATGRVRTGDQLLPVLCHCQLGQDIPVQIVHMGLILPRWGLIFSRIPPPTPFL